MKLNQEYQGIRIYHSTIRIMILTKTKTLLQNKKKLVLQMVLFTNFN